MPLSFVGLIAHAICCLAYAGLAIFHLRRGGSGTAFAWLLVACLATAGWAFGYVLAETVWPAAGSYLLTLGTLRSAAWLTFLFTLLTQSWRINEKTSSSLQVAVVLGLVMAGQLGLDLWLRTASPYDELTPTLEALSRFTRLTISIGGLLLTHNLYVNTAPSSRWSIRLLCIGMAGFFGYDLNYYTLALLTGDLSPDLYNVRGLAYAMVVPLFVLSAGRSKSWRIQVSRQVAFQTFSLAGVGGYLILMSLLGYGLRRFGGDWGKLLQTGFIFATLLLAAVVILSGRFRAWALVQINKHFFAYKYDYREEWLRFITTISDTGEGAAGPLRTRVIQAVCQIVHSPSGLLCTADEDGGYVQVARWNPLEIEGRIEPGDPLIAYLSERNRIADLDEPRERRGEAGGIPVPRWAEDRRLWLVVPLVHLEQMIGFIVLGRSLAPRRLNWEDYDLLRTAGRQAASYIAEHGSQSKLLESRKFEEFNRRFAFIMHDIKNVASQIGLLARNAERHAENPEFRKDMIETLNASVKRMNDLLARLGERHADRGRPTGVGDLGAMLRRVVSRKLPQAPGLTLEADSGYAAVEADTERLEQAFEHLVQNAIDASADGRPILIRLGQETSMARIEIIDHGCGMSDAFIRDELFEPFHSTKPGGFGIGAYEAREIVRQAGGRLSVQSREGQGTTFTVTLPLADARPGVEAA